MEAADLGVRLCQSAAREVYQCYLVAALPSLALSWRPTRSLTWLPSLLIWWVKPWLDRTVLFVLSRAAFGQATRVSELCAINVASGGASFSQPDDPAAVAVAILHAVGLSARGPAVFGLGKRVQQIRRGRTTPATLMTSAFSVTETVLTVALVSLIFWFEPGRADPNWTARLASLHLPITCAYALVVLFLEPFYVAAGFAMYLNRRAQLEAWDIEQELRRAFQA